MEDAAAVSRLDQLRAKLKELEDDIDAAREHNAWTAVSTLYNSWRQMEKAVAAEAERVEALDPEADMTDEELLEVVLDAIRAFAAQAPTFFERIAAEVEELG